MELTKRIPEPEIMDDPAQVVAYGKADFSQPHEMFVDLFQERFPNFSKGTVIDLGCGTCDITIRFAKRFPLTVLHGVDASLPMLNFALEQIKKNHLSNRINLIHAKIRSDTDFPKKNYDAVIVNSLLHHLKDPMIFWTVVKKIIAPGGRLFVMDLTRPKNTKRALEIVEKYAANEPEILKRDFYNSLLAAYTLDEVSIQMKKAGLNDLIVEKVSDRHLVVWGHVT